MTLLKNRCLSDRYLLLFVVIVPDVHAESALWRSWPQSPWFGQYAYLRWNE